MVVNLGHAGVERTVEPLVEPVTVSEAKTHLRVDDSVGTIEDTYIETLISTARMMAENFTRRALITQTWRLTLDQWPERSIYLPFPPLQSVSSVKYINTAGVLTTLTEGTDYEVDTRSVPGRVHPSYSQVWPVVRAIENAVTVEFIAGYGNAASDVPEPIRQAILLIIQRLYDHRGDSIIGSIRTDLPYTSEVILMQYRDYRFG